MRTGGHVLQRLRERWRAVGRWRKILIGLTLLTVLALAAPAVVWANTAGHRYSDPGDVPQEPVAIVLGAGLDDAGHPTLFLSERIAIGVQLYRKGVVKALLMSGDNSRPGYDEVGVMAAEAQRLGVPAGAIVQDHAGFDTFSSCYRARSVWGISRAVLVSQPFHLARALWLCQALGVNAVGAGTANDARAETWYGWVREIPAINKSVLDVWRGRTPTFPGPREHALDVVTAAG